MRGCPCIVLQPLARSAGKDAAKTAAAPVKPPEKDFFDEFVDDPLALAGLGGVLALLGGYGFWAWRRKKKSQTQFQDSVLGAADTNLTMVAVDLDDINSAFFIFHQIDA